MSTATRIEWTRGDDGSAGAIWKSVTGCTKVSEGCDHCYAATLARRLKAMGNPRYQAEGPDGRGFGVTLYPDKLAEPLWWRKPRLSVRQLHERPFCRGRRRNPHHRCW